MPSTVFPSIYRARATRWTGSSLLVLVPQIFGEAPVTVTDFVGVPATGMGWVLFQGGNPEFPVWLGLLTSTIGTAPIGEDEVWVGPGTPPGPQELWYDTDATPPVLRALVNGGWVDAASVGVPPTRTIATTAPLTGGGDLSANRTLAVNTFTATVKGAVPPPTTVTGKVLSDNGSWITPAAGGTGTDEVWIGTDDPIGANPTIELWYDSDDDPVATDQANYWNSSWGVVGKTQGTSIITTSVAPTTLASVTWTAVAGRQYRAVWHSVDQFQGGATFHMVMYIDASAGFYAGTALADYRMDGITANGQHITEFSADAFVVNAGQRTINLTYNYPNGYQYILHGDWGPWYLTVEDAGPVTRAAVNPPAGQPQVTAAGNALGIVVIGAIPANTLLPINAPQVAWTPQLAVTLLVGRRYRIRGISRAIGAANKNFAIDTGLYDNGTNTTLMDSWSSGAVNYDNVIAEIVINGDGLAHLYDLRSNGGATDASQTTIFGGTGSMFYVEDVGPNQAPALPIPDTPPGWTLVTAMQNGWVAVGGPWEPPRYRKIGDMVQLGGNIYNGTANQAAFTLPVGFRPAYPLEIICSGYNASTGRIIDMITIDANGSVRPEIGGGPSVSLSTVAFSVTP